MKNGFWRRVFAYTSFYRTMGAVVSDTMRYAKEGNYRPLITLILGAAVLGSAERDGRRLVMVIAGSKSADERANAARALFEWGFSAWAARPCVPLKGEGEMRKRRRPSWAIPL